MNPREVAASFVKLLETMDANLNVRWGSYMKSWVIERKAIIPPTELDFLARRFERAGRFISVPDPDPKEVEAYKGIAEEFQSAKRGYRVVVFASRLDMNTYNALCVSDIQRYGGYSRYADELEKSEELQREALERKYKNKREDMNKEAFDVLNFLWDKKSTLLEHGEKDLNVLLHGKKRNKSALG